MRAFKWQGGIHLEPETAEEGKAMWLLFDSVRRSTIHEPDTWDKKLAEGEDQINESTTGLKKHVAEGSSTDL